MLLYSKPQSVKHIQCIPNASPESKYRVSLSFLIVSSRTFLLCVMSVSSLQTDCGGVGVVKKSLKFFTVPANPARDPTAQSNTAKVQATRKKKPGWRTHRVPVPLGREPSTQTHRHILAVKSVIRETRWC